MCNCPTAGVFATHETHRSWIIFKETNTEKGPTSMVYAGTESTSKTDDLENVHLLLDEELRPATPDYSDPKSVALFEEHKTLTREYFKVQTELFYQAQKCEQLKAAQSEENQQRRKTIEQLQSEKESLMLLRENLLKQKQAIARATSNESTPQVADWVLLPDQDDTT